MAERPAATLLLIPFVSVSSLILCGDKPGSIQPSVRKGWEEKMGRNEMWMGKGKERKVVVSVVQGTRPLVPLEKPEVCAERAARWIVGGLGGVDKE